MPLVRLEVENFKSYRGKQTIGPFHSFTAVIGPNGSGKSNIMDALSFVLGFKSAQLRSTQLRDLIYRGGRTETASDDGNEEEDEDTPMEEKEGVHSGRSPISASKASVTAVYQKSDGTELRFYRSIALSGASEYRYNNQVISATAYNDRLQSLNILVKAKNFLVFQGDVEAVASQSPKELSRLVDQISGSLEFKEEYERAKVAQDKALEAQKYALFRRKGMTNEVNFFKGQKSEAERFKQLQQERDEHVVRQVVWKLFHISKKITDDSKDLEKISSAKPSLQKNLDSAERLMKRRRNEQAQVSASILSQRKAVRAIEREVERQQPDLDAIETKLAHAREKIANAEKMCKGIEPEVTKYKASIAKLEKDHERAKEAADRAAAEHASVSSAQGFSLTAQDMAQYHELKATANLRASNERQKLEILSRDIKAKQGALQSLQDKLIEAQNQRSRLQKEVEDLRDRRHGQDEKRKEAQRSLEELRSAQEKAEAAKAAIHQQEIELNHSLKVCLDKINEAGVARHEQERERKKKEQVVALQREIPSVHGRVADLCRPTQGKYETAISTVLGRNADAIVVDTQKDAIQCINRLNLRRLGMATFIPLDTAQVKEVAIRLRSIAPGARLAYDIITFDDKVERAMRYACGNALVCDDLSIARSVCYEKRQEVKAVTLDGTVIHKSGLISGGQSGEERIRRWEDREVDKLERQREELLLELTRLGKERQQAIREGESSSKVTSLSVELATLNDDISALDTRLKGLEDEIKVLDRQLTQLSPRVTTAQKQLDDATKQTVALQNTVDEEDDTVFADFCKRIDVKNIREYEERQLKMMQQQDDVRAEYEQQMKRLQHTMTFEKARLSDQENRLQHNGQTIAKRTEEVSVLQAERDRLRSTLQSISQDIEQMKEELEQRQSEETSTATELKQARKQVEEAQSALDANGKEAASLRLALELLATERLKLYRRCRLEEIDLPLQSGSKELKTVPLEDSGSLPGLEDESMNLDDDEQSQQHSSKQVPSVPDYGIKVNFSGLSAAEKKEGGEEMGQELDSRIESATAELDKMQPHLRVGERLQETEDRLAAVDGEFDRARREAKKTQDRFVQLRKQRCDLFNRAFDHISSKIDSVYKELTKSKVSPRGGSAHLVLENSDEPYLGGVQFSAIPPSKTFRNIDHLSGGEKTMAAIALLFAVQSVRPAPFIVLDEVDAALDSMNVQRVANYIRSRAGKDLQFIVISHKNTLFESSSALVGVMRKQHFHSSATLTLNLEQYA